MCVCGFIAMLLGAIHIPLCMCVCGVIAMLLGAIHIPLFICVCGFIAMLLWLQEYEKKQREEERQKQLDDLEGVRQAHSRYVQKVSLFCLVFRLHTVVVCGGICTATGPNGCKTSTGPCLL
jgi:uncharacterized membrane protein YuzA (DUF378 family)